MQNNIESIWAAGCPQNVKEEQKLSFQDLLVLGVDYIVKQFALKRGFKIEVAQANIQKLPNIVLKRNDVLYAIAVVPFVYPNYAYLKDEIRIQLVHNVKAYNAIPLYAPIGFRSTDSERAKASMALKGDTFDILFRGFIQLNDKESQNLIVENTEFSLLEE